MKVYDITLNITPHLPVWPGDPPPERSYIWQMGQQSWANVSRITMSAHTGTHVDAPIHFIPGGAGIETLALETLIGPCRVCEVYPVSRYIGAAELEALRLPPDTRRLLLKTRNSHIWERNEQHFQEDFIALSAGGACWLVERGVRLVGIDYLSIEAFDTPEPIVHRTILASGIVALEGINLTGITPGAYTLICLPIKLKGSDGAPARVVLIEDET